MSDPKPNPSTIAVGAESRARIDRYIDNFAKETGIRPAIASVVRRALAIGLDSMETHTDQTSEEKYRGK